ncbi:MAG: Ig-like domain-containing protein [Agathobacter sp.]|nr:Ig-like domain-containing protein [Agathobacter sp.]
MKSSKKALAFALAAAMVVTAVPVTPAEAASAPKLSAKSVTVAAGTAKKQSKTIKVTTPSTWKSVKVSAKSSATGTAKVSVSGKTVKVTAVKKGTAKVTVTVTAKKSGKKVSKKLTATAKVVNAGLKVTAPTEVVVGSETKLTTKVCPSAAKTTFKSSDDTIATVDENGTVKAVKAGDVTITTTTDYGKSVESKIVVKKAILKDVKQTETNKLEATIEGDTSSLKANDFVITNTYSKANFAVKSVTVDSTDKTKITIETFVAMTDGKDYTVTFDGTTKTITATDGKVTAIAITPATVTVPTPVVEAGKTNPNTIVITYTDANGVVISTTDAGQKNAPSGFTYVDVDVDTTNVGYVTSGVLTLYKAGSVAKVKVVAHTGKYDASAQEVGNLTAEATITGVDATAVTTSGWNVKFGKASDTATEFKNVKETQVAAKDTDAVAYIQRATSDGKTADAADYKFESSDVDVMTVGTPYTSKGATAVAINPYKAGSAYIIVKDSKGNVVTTLPVTIGAERKAATLTLDKNSFTLSSADGIDATATVKATVKDQYGADVTVSKLSYKLASQPDSAYQDVLSNKITIAKPALKDDKDTSYTYIVKYGDLKTTFVITVRKAEATSSTYALELSADSVDAIVKSDATADTTITAKVCGYDKNGVKVEDGVNGATFALTKDGKEAKDAADSSTSSTIKVNDIASGKQMGVGTYLVTAKVGDKTFTKTFEVKNSQPVATASLKETEVTSGTALKSILKVVYNGNELKDAEYSVEGDPVITTTKNFDKITVVISVGSNKVKQEITLGKTVVVK